MARKNNKKTKETATNKDRQLILILGDQLSTAISSLNDANKDRDQILMAEVREEATYVRHHKKKIAFLFSAMRHFAAELKTDGWDVRYIEYDAKDNAGSLTAEIDRAIDKAPKSKPFTKVVVTEPGEYRLLESFKMWSEASDLPLDIRTDDRFIATHDEFNAWADGKKQLRMEFFYREMRRKTDLLMDGDDPEGGKWNYDAENRKPADDDLFMPKVKRFEPDDITRDVLELVEKNFADHFGDLEPFWFATTKADAEKAWDHFCKTALPSFGDYQDAMLTNEKFLYHSLTSMYLNAGLLDPLEMCQRVEKEYRKGKVPLNAAEGFIRQIIGWREYIRGIYWREMPGYETSNFFNAKRDLPDFYWTGDTKMACLAAAITQTKEEAYAHHIQRLMVTGNFAMLTGVEPKQINEWYLVVYADAYEWVEMPNVIGMSQFADGGLLASKPYASGGNYINKMSDYCGNCAYKVKDRTGDTACPFNYLYWDFLDRNRDKLKSNQRLGMVYRTWDKMADAKKTEVRDSAKAFLDAL